MGAGRMSHRVTFQRPVEADDGGGGFERTWTDHVTVWADYRPERGRERVAADRVQAQVAGTLTIRASAVVDEIDPAWSVAIEGERHDIRSVTTQRHGRIEFVVERSA